MDGWSAGLEGRQECVGKGSLTFHVCSRVSLQVGLEKPEAGGAGLSSSSLTDRWPTHLTPLSASSNYKMGVVPLKGLICFISSAAVVSSGQTIHFR